MFLQSRRRTGKALYCQGRENSFSVIDWKSEPIQSSRRAGKALCCHGREYNCTDNDY